MIIFINIPRIRFIALAIYVIGIDLNIIQNIDINFQIIARYLE